MTGPSEGSVREAYLLASDSSVTLLDQPAVAAAWGPPSALAKLLEIVIHSDDLAVSVEIPTPELPASVTDPVLGLLCRLATERHGPTAVLRALSRSERAPLTVSAF